MSVPTDPIFDLTSQGSWTAWVKLDHHVGDAVQHIVTVNQGGVSGRQWALEINQANKLQMAIRRSDSSNWIKCADSQDFPLNQWVFVAATYDKLSNPSLYLYRGGNLVASNNAYHGDINTRTLSELRISSDVWEFNGLIDEVEIYNRALLLSEIQGIYNAGSAGKCKVIKVEINIKPGSYPNSINTCSGGSTPVIIFGSETFDVATIDPTQLALGTAIVKTVGKSGRFLCSIEDVGSPDPNMFDSLGDPDGFPDLICHFVTDMAALDDTSTTATVSITGCDDPSGGCDLEDVGYYVIIATDSVNIVKDCDKP